LESREGIEAHPKISGRAAKTLNLFRAIRAEPQLSYNSIYIPKRTKVCFNKVPLRTSHVTFLHLNIRQEVGGSGVSL
jgi:hypothetical protein